MWAFHGRQDTAKEVHERALAKAFRATRRIPRRSAAEPPSEGLAWRSCDLAQLHAAPVR
jgi:hypothetical protein